MSVGATGKVTFLFHYVYDYTSPLPFILEGGRERERGGERERGEERETERETKRDIERERDRQTDRQTETKRENQIDRHRESSEHKGYSQISILTNLKMYNFALLCPTVLYLPICFWVSLHNPLNLDLFANGQSTRNRTREWKRDLQQMYYDSMTGKGAKFPRCWARCCF